MARLIGKSKQLVSAWEQGRSEILVSTLVLFAQILNVDINWLLLGVKNDGDGLLNLPAGNLFPILRPAEVIEFAFGHLQLQNITSKAYSYFPVGPGSFGFEMPDSSMDGTISRGELVIIDPDQSIEPGGLVAAVVQVDNGAALPSPILVLREISFLSTHIGKAPYNLAPSGRGYSKISVHKPEDAALIGSMVVSVRRSVQRH